MSSIQQYEDGHIEVLVDTSIYDDWVIEKVLYWWTTDYVITRNRESNPTFQTISFVLKRGHKAIDFQKLKEKMSDDFIDYKNRQTIRLETSNIRDLLFAKAFANNDDFIEVSFKD